jgi:signal transduction histidine kinase
MTDTRKKPESTDAQDIAWLGLTSAAWAHRLSNTLGIIPILIEQIREGLDDKEQVLSYLSKIERAVIEQLDFAKELRGFSRLSAGSGIGPVSVNSVVQKVWEDHYKPSAGDKTPEFRLNLASGLPEVKSDEQLLGEVIRNLVDNSIRAVETQEDGVIEIRTHRINDEIAIDVSDNGAGIPPELAVKLFREPIPGNREGEGLGIGLYISRTLVDMWDGTLSLVKTDKKGTTVRAALAKWETSTAISTARRALVVEDNANWRELLHKILSDRGLAVDEVSSISEAMQVIEANHYDLALLDLRLDDVVAEDVTGLNIARLVRERNPESLIVVLTGYPTYPAVREAFGAGIDEFLDKASFSPAEIDRVLDKVAVRRETERESIRQSQLNRLMYEVLSMISHELRAPLLTVQRNAEALGAGALGPLTPDQAEAVDTITFAVRREFVLLNAHLDLNRIERNAEKLDCQEYDLVSLIREEVAAHQTEAKRKRVRLQTQLPKQEAVVRIDVSRFRVALNPIMDNAIKFSPEDSEVSIEVRLFAEYVEVSVSDKGPGIKPNELNYLLSWRTAETASFTQRIRSSGLGLSMARRMIELHGGKLWIESVPGSGTTVSFRLPFKE